MPLPAAPVARPPSPVKPWPQRLLHWLTLAAIVLGLSAVWGRELLDDKGLRSLLLAVHRNIGLLVWLALALRLAVRTVARTPSAPSPRLMRWAAALTHLGMYGLLFAIPLVGWLLSSARGQPVTVLGRFTLPPITGTDPDLADLWADRHALLAWVLIGTVLVHMSAALWHHWVLKDGTLRAMWPRSASPL